LKTMLVGKGKYNFENTARKYACSLAAWKDGPFLSDLFCLRSVCSGLFCLFWKDPSILYLRSAGQSGCMEGWAASNSRLSLRFELSLVMRGNAVMSTEKRWAL